MVGWVGGGGSTGAEGNDEIMASRGAERGDYILKHLSMMLRKGQGTLTTKQTHSEVEVQKKKTRRLTKYQLEHEFGAEKAAYWIPHLAWHPDRVTGCTDEKHREYELPENIVLGVSTHGKQTEVDAKQEAKASDLGNLAALADDMKQQGLMTDQEMANKDKVGSSGGNTEEAKGEEGKVEIKQEKKEDGGNVDEKVEAFLANPSVHLAAMQSASTMLKQIAVAGSTKKFAESFVVATKELAAKCDRTAKIIDRLVVGASPNKSVLPKLINNIAVLNKEAQEYKSVAETSFGIKVQGGSAPKRARKQK